MLYKVKIDDQGLISATTVDQSYIPEDNEAILSDEEYHYFCANGPYARITDSKVIYDLTSNRCIQDIPYTPTPDYVIKRVTEYPSIGDQLDAIWKYLNPEKGTSAYDMQQILLGIKAKYPKSSSEGA